MGAENELYTTNQTTDSKSYDSSLVDLWNRITPINSTRIGNTTVVDGTQQMNENKTFNKRPIQDLVSRYEDKNYETQDESAPYFYELENVDTGIKKYGIAPRGLEHRYAGQNMSQWKVNYNKRRTDAVELESLIHGNETMLKQRIVDTGLTKNTQLQKGATEIYNVGLDKVNGILSAKQKEYTSKLVDAVPDISADKPDTSYGNSSVDKLFGKTMAESIPQKMDMDSITEYVKNIEAKPQEAKISSGIKDESQLYTNPDFVKKTRNVFQAFGVDTASLSDEQVVGEMLNEQSKYGFNITDMAYKVSQFSQKDPQVSKDWLELQKMYEDTDLSLDQISRGTKALLSDPTTYAMIGSMGLTAPARVAGQSALKQAMNKAVTQNAITGAVEGAAYNTADNLLRQKMEINAEKQKSYKQSEAHQATSLGALFGGTLGGVATKALGGNEEQQLISELAKNVNKPAKDVESTIVKPKEEQKEDTKQDEIQPIVDEKKFNLANDIAIRKTKPKVEAEKPKEKTKVPLDNRDKITKEEYIDETEPKVITKPKRELKTKAGTVIDSEEVKNVKRITENQEFEVSSPTPERKPIEGNEYVPETNNPLKLKIKYDDVGRTYTEEKSLLSYQGTADQKATLKQKIRDGVSDADEEVTRRLEFYDRSEDLRQRYGRTEAKFDERVDIPKSKAEADRLRFQIDQYKEILKNEILTEAVRKQARKKIKDLYDKKIEFPRAPDELAAKAEQKFIDENPIERIADAEKRNKDLKTEFEMFKSTFRNQEGYVYKPSQPIEQVRTNSIKNAKANKTAVVKAIQKIKIMEKRLGHEDFSPSKITPKIRDKYKDEVTLIDNYNGALEDLIANKKGALSDEEFMFRARRRVDDEVAGMGKTFDNIEDYEKLIEDIINKYDETGTRVTRKQIEEDFGYEPTGKQEQPEAKKKREAKEIEQSRKINANTIANLKAYEKNLIMPRHKSGQKAGKQALNSSQTRDIKEGILTFEEIANKTAPISTRAGREDAIKQAREHAKQKVNTTKSKRLGAEGNIGLPESIIFKDSVKDVSNSMAQIVTVLLGSKRLGKLTKMTGSKVDVRDAIGEQMAKMGVELPKDKDGKETNWKAVVKPIFMTGNYGQMEKGLVENLVKAHNMSKDEATVFYNNYEKALDEVLPEFKNFKKQIYDLYKEQGKVKLEWTLPDGFPVKINVAKDKEGRIVVRDVSLKVRFVTDDFNDFSRAIMPRLIQSVDGYISRQLQKQEFPMVHDAAIVGKGREELIDASYKKIMTDINDSDLLHDIMKQLGYTGKPLKEGTLTREDIEGSEHMLGFEHRAGEADEEGTKLRTRDMSKQLSDEEIMRDFMASKNYRQIPTSRLVDALVNEAGYNNAVLSVAREGDDVFERQTALAFQSPNYNSMLALKPPKGTNVRMWNKAQEEIFHEARAKLEYHPWLAKSDIVQGDRKWFNKDGGIIGQYNKTYGEIYEELYQEFLVQHNAIKQPKEKQIEQPMSKANFRFSKDAKFATTFAGMTDKKTFVKNVDNLINKQGNDVVTLEEAILKGQIAEAKTKIVKSKWQGFKTLWNEQIEAKGKYKEFNLLQRMKNVFASEVDRDAEILYKTLAKIPKEKKADLMKLLKSDVEAIWGMTRKESEEFKKANNTIYTIAKLEIDQSAKGLSSQSEQYGAYKRNPTLIAAARDLPDDAIPIIDQLVSIKAMDNNGGWEVLEKYPRDGDIKYIVDIMREHRMKSEAELFIDSPDKISKGYFGEVYRGNKKILEVHIRTKIIRKDRIKNGTYTNGDGFEYKVHKENGKSYYYKDYAYDADSKYEQGILGAERENNKVGAKVNIKDLLAEHKDIEDIYVNYFDPQGWNIDKLNPKQQEAFEKLNMKYYLDEKMTQRQTKYLGDLIKLGFDFANSPEGLAKKYQWMAKNRLRESSDGTFRKVADETIRLKAGKTDDLAHILTETVRATNQKLKERQIVLKVIQDLAVNESLIFSTKPKDGFVKLTFEQLNKLPFSLREDLKYVDQELMTKLLGREEVRMYKGNNQHLLIADRLVNNLGTMFKQSVVLKNPASYINATLVNQAIGLSIGVRPDKMFKYQLKAMQDFKQMTELLEKLNYQKVTGKKRDAILDANLKNNQLYKMEKAGLSTNRVDGIVGDNDLLGSILEDHVPSVIFKVARTLNLNQNTAAGKFTLRMFSKIDTMGRYMVAQHYIDKGIDMKEAVEKANGFFGNMDIIVPAAIEMLDKYGFVPFLKWFTLVHPMLVKTIQTDPVKMIAVATGIYVLGQETNTNLASVNPLEGMVDFVESSLPFGTVEKIEKKGFIDTIIGRAKSNVVPKYMDNIWKSPETLGVEKLRKKRMSKPKSDKYVDYRGFSQQTIEDFNDRRLQRTNSWAD